MSKPKLTHADAVRIRDLAAAGYTGPQVRQMIREAGGPDLALETVRRVIRGDTWNAPSAAPLATEPSADEAGASLARMAAMLAEAATDNERGDALLKELKEAS